VEHEKSKFWSIAFALSSNAKLDFENFQRFLSETGKKSKLLVHSF
jgi:hypothetical protein